MPRPLVIPVLENFSALATWARLGCGPRELDVSWKRLVI